MREKDFFEKIFNALKFMQIDNFDYEKTHKILLDISRHTIESIDQLRGIKCHENSDKYVILFAGPNASGKSTIASKMLPKIGLPFLNPDMVARLLFNHISDEEEKYRTYAMPYTAELRNRFIESGSNLSLETVFSDYRKLALISELKNQGYRIYVVWMGTENPSINAERALKRQAEGGHFVPHDKIQSRYYKSMQNLSNLIEISDSAIVIDNSKEPFVVVQKSNERYKVTDEKHCSEWVKLYLLDRL